MQRKRLAALLAAAALCAPAMATVPAQAATQGRACTWRITWTLHHPYTFVVRVKNDPCGLPIRASAHCRIPDIFTGRQQWVWRHGNWHNHPEPDLPRYNSVANCGLLASKMNRWGYDVKRGKRITYIQVG